MAENSLETAASMQSVNDNGEMNSLPIMQNSGASNKENQVPETQSQTQTKKKAKSANQGVKHATRLDKERLLTIVGIHDPTGVCSNTTSNIPGSGLTDLLTNSDPEECGWFPEDYKGRKSHQREDLVSRHGAVQQQP